MESKIRPAESAGTAETKPEEEQAKAQGFEAYFSHKKVSAQREHLKVLCYSVKDLVRKDLSDLEALRAAALENYEKSSGIELKSSSLLAELKDRPRGRTLSDKLVVKAYNLDDELVAYAQVICGWPQHNSWAIDQLLLDPNKTRQGLGSKLINIIENLARTAEVQATSIISLPSRPNSESFWKAIGYLPLEDNDPLILKKEL